MPFHILKTLGRRAALTLVAALIMPAFANAQACPQRGELDPRFCDANGDLLADPPADKAAQKNPDTLVHQRPKWPPSADTARCHRVFSPDSRHYRQQTCRALWPTARRRNLRPDQCPERATGRSSGGRRRCRNRSPYDPTHALAPLSHP